MLACFRLWRKKEIKKKKKKQEMKLQKARGSIAVHTTSVCNKISHPLDIRIQYGRRKGGKTQVRNICISGRFHRTLHQDETNCGMILTPAISRRSGPPSPLAAKPCCLQPLEDTVGIKAAREEQHLLSDHFHSGRD